MRNSNIDLLRGVAILMVLLQHTISVSTKNAEETLFFNAIWSLQMPLFFLISGYLTRLSQKSFDEKELVSHVLRRTKGYLYPWVVWTIFIRGILFGEKAFLDIPNLVYHMDTGYWFLVSLWFITLVFAVSQYMSQKLYKGTNEFVRVMCVTAFYVLGMGLLAGIALWKGMSFLGMKLTLYYMPFFFAGSLWHWVDSETEELRWKSSAVQSAVIFSGVIWAVLLWRFNFFYIADTLIGIVIRAAASIAGCVFLSGLLCRGNHRFEKCGKVLQKVGEHSLELYLIQYLVMAPISLQDMPVLATGKGIGVAAANYAITVAASILIAALLNRNVYVKKALFGKS